MGQTEEEKKAAFTMAEMEMEYRVDLFTRCVLSWSASLLHGRGFWG
jgi:hypothetical protein